MAMRSAPRLLIYSQDGLGLGHLRRTTLLAGEFLAACGGGSALTISDSPIGQFFDACPGHDYLKLPSIRKVGPGNWQPVAMSLPFRDVLRLRKQVIRTTAMSFQPDVLLVDHMPHGAMGELLPTLEALEGSATRIVLGLRDIIDAPATVRQRWRLEGAFEAVERHFKEVLVYGSRDVFDVAAQYGWPPRLAARLRYCGYVCASPALAGAEAIRRRFLRDVPDGRLVVATAGGGADAYALFDTLLRAVPSLNGENRCVVVMVTGPFLPEEERRRLEVLAEGLPVHLIGTVSESMSYLGAADLVVAMAGYNTTAEILSLGAPALLVPRSGPSAEQQMRAGSFADRGWVKWIRPDNLTPEVLADAITDAILDGPRAVVTVAPDLQGRQRAARHLLSSWARPPVNGTPGDPMTPTAVGDPLEDTLQVRGEG
jgi:predicted glycosyltransferase